MERKDSYKDAYPIVRLENRSSIFLLINCLRKNSNLNFFQISKKTKIPLVNIYEYYFLLKKNKIIRESIVLNYEMLGFDIRSFIHIELRNDSKYAEKSRLTQYEIIDYLIRSPYVNNLYLLETGLLVDVFYNSIITYEKMIKDLKEFDICSLQEYQVLDQTIQEKFQIGD